MDELDKKILGILKEQGRIPYVNLAQMLKVSEATIRYRVRNLLEKGIIKRFTVEIDPAKLGFRSRAVVGIDADPEDFLSVINKLMGIEEIKGLATSTGDHMMIAEVWARSSEELLQIINKIGEIKGIKRICPAIILEELK